MKYTPTGPAPSLDSKTEKRNRLPIPAVKGWLTATLAMGCLCLGGTLMSLAASPLPTSASKSNLMPLPPASERAEYYTPEAETPTPTHDSVVVVRNPQPIPFNANPFFAENRVGNPDVKLPPMPGSLFPIPPPERQPTPIVLPTPKLPSTARTEPAPKPASTKTTLPTAAHGQAIVGTSTTPDENIAVSPFINWINNTPNASDVARQSQDGYSVNGVATGDKNALSNGDVFFNIRFPYVGSEQTGAGTSAAIYSTPQR